MSKKPGAGKPRGTVYAAGGMLYLNYYESDGRRVQKSSGCPVGQESQAWALLREIQEQIKTTGAVAHGPMTLERYAERWLKEREAAADTEGKSDDRGRWKNHIAPELGTMVLAEIRPRHVGLLVRKLREKPSARGRPMAPKTVRAVYETLRCMLVSAVFEEHIAVNPCSDLPGGILPGKVDADPTWRATAIFTRAEVETILSDERSPDDRRVVYALLFLAGIRFGESSALRWRNYTTDLEPLGRLDIALSYNTKRRKVKSTKTDNPRQVPVHPALAAILAEWKLGGWERLMGRKPEPDDLLIPSREGRNRNVNHGLKRFHEDLVRLGLRKRRQHDARRTFISLAIGDGARKDVLRWVTHGPRGDIMSAYTTLPWSALCEAVSCLRVERRTMARVIALVAAGGRVEGSSAPLAETYEDHAGAAGQPTPVSQKGCETSVRAPLQKAETPAVSTTSGVSWRRGGRDSNEEPHK